MGVHAHARANSVALKMVQAKEEHDVLLQRTHAHHVVELIFNRPHRLNALDEELYRKTAAALKALSNDDHTRIIVLSACASRSFCSGMDIKQAATRQCATHLVAAAREFMHALMGCEKIVVAVVFGRVVGIGVTMLLHCDFVFCDAHTTFQTPFASVGICPEFGSSLTFGLFVGKQLSARLLLRGDVVDASSMEKAGVCDIIEQTPLLQAVLQRCVEWSEGTNDLQWSSVLDAKRVIKQSTLHLVRRAMRTELSQIERDLRNGRSVQLMRARL